MNKTIIRSVFILGTSFIASNVAADTIYNETAATVCQAQSQVSYAKKCMAQIKKKQFNDQAVEYCGTQKSWSKTRDCLTLIEGKNFETAALTMCTDYKQFNSNMKKCINEVANKTYLSSIELDMCKKESTIGKKIKCIQSAESQAYVEKVAEPVKEENDAAKQLAELQATVKKVYGLLRENKATDATLVLHETVKSFPKEETSAPKK